MIPQLYDQIIINDKSHRHKDENGHLIIKDNPVAIAGVLPFLRGQIDPQTTQDSNEVVYVLRSNDSLQQAYQMFSDKPIVYNHEWVGKGGDRNNADGHIGSRVYYKDGGVYGDLIIYNSDLIDKIENGECTQLSAGYSAVAKPEVGKYQDQDYTYSIFYTGVNHLAVVEQGRAGSQLSIKDKGILMDNLNAIKDNRINQGTDCIAVASPCELVKDEERAEEEEEEKKDTPEEEERTKEDEDEEDPDRDRKEDTRTLVYKACKQKVKRGEMTQDDMNYVMQKFTFNKAESTMKREFDSIKKTLDHYKRLEDINKAVDEIRSFEITKDFNKLDNADVNTQYERAYNYATREQLPDGMDPRTAFITYVTSLQKQREISQHKYDTAPVDNGLVKQVMDTYNNLIHRQKEVTTLLKRRAF